MITSLLRYFESRIEAFPDGGHTPPPASLGGFFWFYVRPAWPWFVLMGAVVALISVLEVSLFGFLGNIVEWLGTAERATFLHNEGGRLAIMAVVIMVVLPALVLFNSLLTHQVVLPNFPMSIRWRAHRYMLDQSYAFYQDEFAGRIATKVMQTSLAIRDALMKVMEVLTYVLVYFIGAMVLMASFDIYLMLPFIVWLVGYIAMLKYFMPRLKAVAQKQADARSEMTGRVVDSYTNILTVKLFAHAGREAAYARDGMQRFIDTVYPQMRYVTGLVFVLALLNYALLLGVGAVGIALWLDGDVGVGAFATGVALVLRLHGFSHWIMWELSGLFENIGVAIDGMSMLSREQTVTDRADAKPLDIDRAAIEFDAIRFHYGKEAGVIENLSLTIAPGEKIGLVGRSGAGKTTMTNLLLRLYDLEDGQIRIGGTDIATVQQASLRQHIGVVTQDSALLHRTVYDNIAYGKPGVTREEVIEAARRANAHDFIQGLSDAAGRQGYDATVGERGVKLSGGQRQRIAIARMFLKDAPILVLDEATSALDSEVEAAIQENLAELMQGKTVIAIAHRLSTIAALDRLVVMDAGRIIEQGTHAELVASGGLYAALWSRQSGGFLCEDDGADGAERTGPH